MVKCRNTKIAIVNVTEIQNWSIFYSVAWEGRRSRVTNLVWDRCDGAFDDVTISGNQTRIAVGVIA